MPHSAPPSPEIRLTIAYSSLGARAAQIRYPDARDGVEILALFQATGSKTLLPPSGRPDIRVIHLPGQGVARSRNAAIDNANGAILLFADDDIKFDLAAIERVLAQFSRAPDLVLALAQAQDPEGRLRKAYPKTPQRLTRLNSAKAATYEMLVRVAPLREFGLRFDEKFGAGMPDFLGDEYIFIADLVGAGQNCWFFPETIATHPVHSSGLRWNDAVAMRARRAVFRRVFGWAAPVVFAAFRLKHWLRR